MILVCLLAAGCGDRLKPPAAPVKMAKGYNPLKPPAREKENGVTSGARPDRPVRRLMILVDVYFLRVPVTARGELEAIWGYVEPEAVGADEQVFLARNGVRAGLGSPAAWDRLKTIFDENRTVVTKKGRLTIRGSGAIEIELSDQPRDETIFFYNRGGGLAGMDFFRARNFFKVSTGLAFDDLETVEMLLVPGVRGSQKHLKYARRGGRIRMVPRGREKIFHHLAFTVRIPPDHFLLVGPSSQEELSTSLGRHFFCVTKAHRQYHRLYVLAPQVAQK